MQYRQGDVLLVRVKNLPCARKQVEREKGRIVLAHGEATNHAHVVTDPRARLWENGGNRYLEVVEPAELTHEEHGAIALEPGRYKVIRQREYIFNDKNDHEHIFGGTRYVWD
jgi:hypothetical protein